MKALPAASAAARRQRRGLRSRDGRRGALPVSGEHLPPQLDRDQEPHWACLCGRAVLCCSGECVSHTWLCQNDPNIFNSYARSTDNSLIDDIDEQFGRRDEMMRGGSNHLLPFVMTREGLKAFGAQGRLQRNME